MKTTYYFFLVAFVFTFLVCSCEKDKEKSKQLTLTGQLVNHSACKSGLNSPDGTTEIPDTLSCIDYSFDTSNNKLSMKHINAGFNCCPDSIYCNVAIMNDTIIVQECEKNSLCNCLCLYDLDIEINGVDSKKYQVRFIEPYSGEQDKLIFGIDLTIDLEGSYCVIRKQYPWGIPN